MSKKEIQEAIWRPDWDLYFMSLALRAGGRAACYHLKTGSVVVQNKRVIATGYNGASPNVKNCYEQGCKKQANSVDFHDKGKSVCRGTHSELNALLKAGERAEGASLYTLVYPCSSCAKHIDAAGIKRVFWSLVYKEADNLTKEIFETAGIAFNQIDLRANIKKLHSLDLFLLSQGQD
ncbi:MAG: deaminase [Candidatus Pacearchaeota archaeon]|nr:deaminase [Candidatus Pacearchaeota archaeon]